MSETILKGIDLYVSYKTRIREKVVLDNASIDIKSGDFCSIRGASGSGKSTLLGILAGLLRPDEGEVSYIIDKNEINPYELSDIELSKLRSHFISYLPQRCDFVPELSVYDNIRLSDYFIKKPQEMDKEGIDDNKHMSDIIELLGLNDLIQERPEKLSGGELRRMVIARGLYQSPKIMLADEPTNDLDNDNKRSVMTSLKKVSESGTTVVLVTHDEEVAGLANNIYELDQGKIRLL